MIGRRTFLKGTAAAAALASTPSLAQSGGRRPNVLVILTDDLGFADLGCYGGVIETPHLDALAGAATRYTGFRTAAVCAATRAALLTGLNPHSAGIGLLTDEDRGHPGYRGDLTRDNPTTAEVLKRSGYSTFHIGKWHVNSIRTAGHEGPNYNWPLQRGFDRAYWFQGHTTDYLDPSDLYEGNELIEPDLPDDYYITDDLTDRAIGFLQEHRAAAADTPWYMYVAYNAPHSPLQVRAADRDHYAGRFDRGWDALREEIFVRQKALGVVPQHTQLPARNPGVAAWDSLTDNQRRIYARYMEVYAGCVHRLDWNIGRLLDAVRNSGVMDDTLVIFASDNGGSAEGAAGGTPNFLASGNQVIPEEATLALLPTMGERGTFPHYPTGWAMVSNTPFRLYKQFPELGGIADPLIVKWPGAIAEAPGIRHEFINIADVHPTILDVAGAREAQNGQRPVEGVSFVPVAGAAALLNARTQYFEIRGRRAIYGNGWRLVATHQPGTPFENDQWRLYNVNAEFNELTDVAGQHPEVVASLRAAWDHAAQRYNVLPLDNRSPMEKTRNGRWLRPQRSHWELRPGMRRLNPDVAPSTPGRNQTITIRVRRDRADQGGVLLAYGSMYFGWVIYVQDNRLVYEISNVPFNLRVVSDIELPTGAATIRYEQRMRRRPYDGTGHLFIGDREVARFDLPTFAFGVAFQGLELGRNGACPVSLRYEAPFPFAGELIGATIDYDVSPYSRDEMDYILQRTTLRI